MASSTYNGLDSTYLFHQLDSYPWDEDQEFQGGLNAILGSVQDPGQIEHLTLRAKCYYYARKAGTNVDFDGYKQWVESGRQEDSSNGMTNASNAQVFASSGTQTEGSGAGGMANAPKPASFAEICEMIAAGKPIPGIKDIPDTILEGQASQSNVTKRKKPWEKMADTPENPSWMA